MINNELLDKLLKELRNDNEVPVSCFILDKNNKIIAKGTNNRQKKHNILGHAEINAIIQAEKKIKDWRLDGYSILVTLKPCEMCQKIIEEARIDKVFYLLDREKSKNIINNMTEINSNEHKEKYILILSSFFKNKR